MSDNKKAPKPFLKKGTRQFLSNATVRSLNQKNNVVDFKDDNENNGTFIPSGTVSFGKQQPDEIKVEIKRSTFKDP